MIPTDEMVEAAADVIYDRLSGEWPHSHLLMVARAALQAALAVQSEMQWRDISTAPKTKQDVLLARHTLHGTILPPVVAGWFVDDWYSFDDPDKPVQGVITHWMTVPPDAETADGR